MIIEHYENTSNNNIKYDEDSGKFTIKNKFLWFLNIGNEEIFEKDISISKINSIKEQADKTTLTDYDINILYQFAKLQFNYTKSKDEFTNIPIKQIFKGLEDAKLMTNELMPLAYNYIKTSPKDRNQLIEKFSTKSNTNTNKENNLYLYLGIATCMFIILFLIFYWYISRV